MTRKEGNEAILNYLRDVLEQNPYLRFEQLMWNLDGGKDFFYEEPQDTLERWRIDGL